MRKDFFPDREADMVRWSATFAQTIAIEHAALSLPQSLVDDFLVRQAAFSEAFAISNAPDTRTTPSVIRKNDCRRSMESLARTLAAMIRANPAVSDAERVILGLSPRVPRPPRLPTPADAPNVYVDEVSGQHISLRVADHHSPLRRARPDGVAGVTILIFVGAHPSADVALWRPAGNFSSTTPRILVPNNPPPFTPVWITARWYNPRGESGPASVPIETHTQLGGPLIGSLKAA